MGYIDEKAPRPVTESAIGVPLPDCADVEFPMTAIPADRLYRLAAMTAGIFFLATLL